VNDAPLGAEDQKIITLARSARARNGSPEGAAVRDETGRTYVATTVSRPSLQISALALAAAMAMSSGAGSLEAVALVTDADKPNDGDIEVIKDLGPEVVLIAGPDGVIRGTMNP
jgi:hypothetical protein